MTKLDELQSQLWDLKREAWMIQQKLTIVEFVRKAIDEWKPDTDLYIQEIIWFKAASRDQWKIREVLHQLGIDEKDFKDTIDVDEDSRFCTVWFYHLNICISDNVRARVQELIS